MNIKSCGILVDTVVLMAFVSFLFVEISRVRGNLFHLSGVKSEPLELPEACGPVVTLSEKVYVPVKEHPDVSQFIISVSTCVFY